jgi:DNA-binding MarR family transcriptional regulator
MKTETCKAIQAQDKDDFSKSFMYSINQVYFLVEKRIGSVLTDAHKMTFSQFMILVGFKCSEEGPVSQSCIANRLHLTEATVSRHISSLVSMKYLVRKEDTKNRRKHIITITEKGRTAFAEAQALIDTELHDIFSVIKQGDRSSMMKNFENVIKHLTSTHK